MGRMDFTVEFEVLNTKWEMCDGRPPADLRRLSADRGRYGTFVALSCGAWLCGIAGSRGALATYGVFGVE